MDSVTSTPRAGSPLTATCRRASPGSGTGCVAPPCVGPSSCAPGCTPATSGSRSRCTRPSRPAKARKRWTPAANATPGSTASPSGTATCCSSGPRRRHPTRSTGRPVAIAVYWHDVTRKLPPPPTPEELAEAEEAGRRAEKRARAKAEHERVMGNGAGCSRTSESSRCRGVSCGSSRRRTATWSPTCWRPHPGPGGRRPAGWHAGRSSTRAGHRRLDRRRPARPRRRPRAAPAARRLTPGPAPPAVRSGGATQAGPDPGRPPRQCGAAGHGVPGDLRRDGGRLPRRRGPHALGGGGDVRERPHDAVCPGARRAHRPNRPSLIPAQRAVITSGVDPPADQRVHDPVRICAPLRRRFPRAASQPATAVFPFEDHDPVERRLAGPCSQAPLRDACPRGSKVRQPKHGARFGHLLGYSLREGADVHLVLGGQAVRGDHGQHAASEFRDIARRQ